MKRETGFTLIELVVVVGVMAAISSLMLANFPRFNKEVVVGGEASKLSLSLRKAQSYAMAVREFNPFFNDDPFCVNPPPPSQPVKFPPYGVYLTTVSPTQYLIFGDIDCSHKVGVSSYTSNAFGIYDEAIELVNMERGTHINQIIIYDALNNSTVYDSNNPGDVSIIYIRPGPSTIIKSGFTSYDRAEIIISSSDNITKKKVVVRTTSQISVEFVP